MENILLPAMVLCAGLGTRLRPFTDELPKPLVPVGDRPALAHILGGLAQAGARRIVVNTHHRAEDLSTWVESVVARGAMGDAQLVLVHESSILGTAGGISHAGPELGEGAVLVWNGDIWAPDLDATAVCDAFARDPCDALWVVAPKPLGRGTVGLGRDGRVVRVRGRSWGEEHAGADYLGVQVLGEAMRSSLPDRGCLVGDVAVPRLDEGARIRTYTFEGVWDDLGSVAGLWEANQRWLRRHGLSSWTAPSASVASTVTVSRSIVGEGAHIDGVGFIDQCLVFPEAVVCAPQVGRVVSAGAAIAVPFQT